MKIIITTLIIGSAFFAQTAQGALVLHVAGGAYAPVEQVAPEIQTSIETQKDFTALRNEIKTLNENQQLTDEARIKELQNIIVQLKVLLLILIAQQ